MIQTRQPTVFDRPPDFFQMARAVRADHVRMWSGTVWDWQFITAEASGERGVVAMSVVVTPDLCAYAGHLFEQVWVEVERSVAEVLVQRILDAVSRLYLEFQGRITALFSYSAPDPPHDTLVREWHGTVPYWLCVREPGGREPSVEIWESGTHLFAYFSHEDSWRVFTRREFRSGPQYEPWTDALYVRCRQGDWLFYDAPYIVKPETKPTERLVLGGSHVVEGKDLRYYPINDRAFYVDATGDVAVVHPHHPAVVLTPPFVAVQVPGVTSLANRRASD